MWSFIPKFFSKDNETTLLTSSVNEDVISDAYKSVEKEIESLQKYDKGEKEINAPDLKSTLRSVS